MKNYFKIISIIIISGLVVFTSCKKDNEENTPSDYLTSGTWKVTGTTINPGIEFNGIVITDIYNLFIEDCTKDDLITFEADGTLIEDEGPTKCDPDDPQTTNDGKWSISEDGKTMTLTYPDDDPQVANVVSISESTLVISTSLNQDFGIGLSNYTATITMTKQ